MATFTLDKFSTAEVRDHNNKEIATAKNLSYTVGKNGSIIGTIEFKWMVTSKRHALLKPFDVTIITAFDKITWVMQVCGIKLMVASGTPKDVKNDTGYHFIADHTTEWTILKYQGDDKEDDHEGMIYNEYTGEWVWL